MPVLIKLLMKTVLHLLDLNYSLNTKSNKDILTGSLLEYEKMNPYQILIFVIRFGKPLLQVMKECVVPYRVAFGLPKGSIHNADISTTIQQLLEAGLVNKWIKDELDSLAIGNGDVVAGSEGQAQAWSIDKLQATLCSLCCDAVVFITSFHIGIYSRQKISLYC